MSMIYISIDPSEDIMIENIYCNSRLSRNVKETFILVNVCVTLLSKKIVT